MLRNILIQFALLYAFLFAQQTDLKIDESQSTEKISGSHIKQTKTTISLVAVDIEKNIPIRQPTIDDEKHIPIRQPVITCCESPLVFTFDSMPVLPTLIPRSKTKKSSCSIPTETISDTSMSSSSSSIKSHRTRKSKKTEDKCMTTVVDPQTVYVTRTSTVYTTTVRTVKNILRETSFTTTTKTSTIKFTSTVLSISAQTKFSDIIVTLPTYVLVTRFKYNDIIYTSTQTIPTYVLTFTEQETIFRNEYTTTTLSTTVIDCEYSILVRTSTVRGTTTVSFTNPTVTTVSNGFASELITSFLTFTVTTDTVITAGGTTINFLVPATTILSIPTTVTYDVAPKIGATYLTVFVVDPNPATLFAVSSTYSLTIQ